MASRGSFAQRVASIASTIENWDEDGDFHGDLFPHSISTLPTTMSSRVSVRSESNTGDDDWQVLLTPNDEISTINAISSAKQAGIPIPTSVPSSALLGGSIQRLGKKKSTKKIVVDDDWGEDLELPRNFGEGLKLKAPPLPRTPAEEQDDFDDWGEGSLGIRFGGTRRDGRGRGSSVSAMSPSMGSCMTLESEDDDLTGLVLPNEPLDFNARLEKIKKTDYSTPDVSPLPSHHRREPPPTSAPTPAPIPLPVSVPIPVPVSVPVVEQRAPVPAPFFKEATPEPKPQYADDDDDFLSGLEIGAGNAIDTNKLHLNKNVVVKKQPSKPVVPSAARPATTLTFTDKPSISRIPRPLPPANRSRLAPLYETGAPSTLNHNRPMPTTTSAQLLRAKRSAPVLRNSYATTPRPPVPFLPAGGSNSQSHHVKSKGSQSHLRRESDPSRPLSPVATRSTSRMSGTNPPDTPSRAGMRRDLAPAALAREAASKRILAKPAKPKRYGDGSELEVFDDLPTSATKEKKFERVPANRSTLRSVRQQPSISRLNLPDRIATPQPQTPRSPPKVDTTPRFARDTAASRIAREQRLAGTRSRGEGPIPPTHTNWKAQVAARSPHTSPTAQRKRGTGQKPMLIKSMSAPMAKNEKGMTYNPILQRWEGNEDALAPFSHPNTSTTTIALTTASTPTFAPPNQRLYSHDRSHSISHSALTAIQTAQGQKPISSRAVNIGPPSPPRAPALISHISTARGVQVERGMVFDPRKMRWLKLGRPSLGADPRSPSVDKDDEEDPFAGLEDLKDDDNKTNANSAGGLPGFSTRALLDAPKFNEPTFVGEEFDLGPSFIRRQREEENVWRRRVEGWVGGIRDSDQAWRWAVRDLATLASAATMTKRR